MDNTNNNRSIWVAVDGSKASQIAASFAVMLGQIIAGNLELWPIKKIKLIYNEINDSEHSLGWAKRLPEDFDTTLNILATQQNQDENREALIRERLSQAGLLNFIRQVRIGYPKEEFHNAVHETNSDFLMIERDDHKSILGLVERGT